MRLEWSVLASLDRDEIFDHIGANSPRAAASIDDRIGERVKSLAEFPELGRPGRNPGTRELVVNRTPYIVVYRLMADAVLILRILHGARQWPGALSE